MSLQPTMERIETGWAHGVTLPEGAKRVEHPTHIEVRLAVFPPGLRLCWLNALFADPHPGSREAASA